MRFVGSSAEPWLSADSLLAGSRRFGVAVDPYMMPRVIGRIGSGSGYWLLAAVRKVSDEEMREREEQLDSSPLNEPLFKNAVYRGVVWQVALDGSIVAASNFDDFPDGLAGPDHFYSVTEDSTSGFRGVRIYRLRECDAGGA